MHGHITIIYTPPMQQYIGNVLWVQGMSEHSQGENSKPRVTSHPILSPFLYNYTIPICLLFKVHRIFYLFVIKGLAGATVIGLLSEKVLTTSLII